MYMISIANDINWRDTSFMIIGGLGIFLFGITFMGDALKLLAGDKMKQFIEKYTSNPLKGAFVGIAVTALIQSSSGTTALTIGLIRAGLMNLNQAIGIIMGSNIGTTVTAFLIGLKLTDYALPIMALGGFTYMFAQTKKINHYGQVIFGFGALFYGLDVMSMALKPLSKLDVFRDLMVSLSENTFLAITVGTVFTLIVQSSSAAIGILQELYGQGSIALSGALPILFGTNIGTTITAILAAIGGSIIAKRASAAHVFFNISGAILFTLLLVPFEKLLSYITSATRINPETEIAVTHAIFNITMTLLLLPFVNQIAASVQFILPDKKDNPNDADEEFLNYGLISQSPPLAVKQAKNAVIHTGKLVQRALDNLVLFIDSKESKYVDIVYDLEKLIDTLDFKIRQYLVTVLKEEISDHETHEIHLLLQALKDFERMGDHIENLGELFTQIFDLNESLSEDAKKDFFKIYNSCIDVVALSIDVLTTENKVTAGIILEKEHNIDRLELKARKRHIIRVTESTCSGFISTVFVDLVNNLERIADHASNIAEYIINEERTVNVDYELLGKLFDEIDEEKR